MSDPTEAVRRVVAAWRQGDRDAAGLVATPELVTTLFTRPAPAAAPRIQECTLDVPARYGCTVTPASGPSLQFVVEGGASAGYFVTGLTDSG